MEELYDDAFVEEGTLLSILGEDQEVVVCTLFYQDRSKIKLQIRSLIELRADNLTGIRAIDEDNDDRMAILNM